MTANKELLAKTADVRLSLSDWLAWLGWCSAHVSESTPYMITAVIQAAGKQVMEGE